MSSSEKPRSTIQIVAGISLNGKITDESGGFEKYSSHEDQVFLQGKIQESDVLVMGRKTFEKHIKKQKKPLIIFSRHQKGIMLDPGKDMMTHWFNDSKEEFHNLCSLLEYQKICILGGAEVYHWFIEQKLVSDVYLTIEPFIIGEGKHFLEGELLHEQKKWKLQSLKKINGKGSIILHYRM